MLCPAVSGARAVVHSRNAYPMHHTNLFLPERVPVLTDLDLMASMVLPSLPVVSSHQLNLLTVLHSLIKSISPDIALLNTYVGTAFTIDFVLLPSLPVVFIHQLNLSTALYSHIDIGTRPYSSRRLVPIYTSRERGQYHEYYSECFC